MVWLHENFEPFDAASLNRNALYTHYCTHCSRIGQEPMNTASFGKLIRAVFPTIQTRRLGTRGNSKYHYYGIRPLATCQLTFLSDEVGGPNVRYRTKSTLEKMKTKVNKAPSGTSGASKTSERLKPPAVFLNSSVVLGDFPNMSGVAALRNFDDFNKPYGSHCREVLACVCRGEYAKVEALLQRFWAVVAPHFKGMLASPAGVQHVSDCDKVLFDCLADVFLVNVLAEIPESISKDIRLFSKCMEAWTKVALEGQPGPLVQSKLASVRKFGALLRRYTALNHLAQAARPVLNNPAQAQKMLEDIEALDFNAIYNQLSVVTKCDRLLFKRIESAFKDRLAEQFSLETLADWLQLVTLQCVNPSGDRILETERFLQHWVYISSLVLRDLTLRSAASFGSFHLIRLFTDEFMFFLVETVASFPALGLKEVFALLPVRNIAPPPLADQDMFDEIYDEDDNYDDDDFDDEEEEDKRMKKTAASKATKSLFYK